MDKCLLTRSTVSAATSVHVCKLGWGKDIPEFSKWYDNHKVKCQRNHDGSSPTMEMEAAVDLFSRSEELLHLRYTQVLSDGDSKTISHLNEMKPYGEQVTIQKHECVGHVQKRMGKRLETVKKVIRAITFPCIW